MQVLKIAHILWNANIGGIQTLLLQLIREQLDLGLCVRLILCQSRGALLDDFRDVGADVKELHIRNGYFMSASASRNLKHSLKDRDVVHLHSFNPFVARAVRKSKIAVVYSEHGNFATGRRMRAQEFVNQRLLSGFLNRHCDYLLANSHYTLAVARKRYLLKAGLKASVIHNGILLPTEPVEPLPHTGFILGFTGRMVEWKRPDIALKAVSRLIQEGGDFRLIMIGDGPELAGLKREVKAKGITDFVEFTGFLKNVQELYKDIDLAIIPSYKEPFGLVALEYLGNGIPVLVLKDGGGVTEIIEQVDPSDICEDIEGLIARIRHYHSQVTSMDDSRNHRISVAKRFSIGEMAHRLHDIYSSLSKRD